MERVTVFAGVKAAIVAVQVSFMPVGAHGLMYGQHQVQSGGACTNYGISCFPGLIHFAFFSGSGNWVICWQ